MIGDRKLCMEKEIRQEMIKMETYWIHDLIWRQREEERIRGFILGVVPLDDVRSLPFSTDKEKKSYIDASF